MSNEQIPTTVTRDDVPVAIILRWQKAPTCPGCGEPIDGRTAVIYCGYVWCPLCPPCYDRHQSTLLGALQHPQITRYLVRSRGVTAYVPGGSDRLPVDALLDRVRSRYLV